MATDGVDFVFKPNNKSLDEALAVAVELRNRMSSLVKENKDLNKTIAAISAEADQIEVESREMWSEFKKSEQEGTRSLEKQKVYCELKMKKAMKDAEYWKLHMQHAGNHVELEQLSRQFHSVIVDIYQLKTSGGNSQSQDPQLGTDAETSPTNSEQDIRIQAMIDKLGELAFGKNKATEC